MNVIYQFIELGASTLELYIAFQILGLCFYKKHFGRKYQFMVVLISIGILGVIHIINTINLFSYVTVAFFIVCVSLAAYLLFQGTFMQFFSVVCFYTICNGIFEFVVISVLSILFQVENFGYLITSEFHLNRAIYIVSFKTVTVFIYLFIKRRITLIKHMQFIFFLLPVSVIGFVFLYVFTGSTMMYAGTRTFWIWLMVVFLLILLIVFFIVFTRFKLAESEKEMIEIRTNLLEDNYKNLKELYREKSQNFHDFNNHLNLIYNYIHTGKIENALDYIEKISKPSRAVKQYVWSGNEVIDFILNSKIEKAREFNIKVEVKADIVENEYIRPLDICVILSNLLDNAIEASSKVEDQEERYIEVMLRTVNNIIMLRIHNSLKELPTIKNKIFVTTKKTKDTHGWGLRSVETAVRRYGGFIDYSYYENKFAVDVSLHC